MSSKGSNEYRARHRESERRRRQKQERLVGRQVKASDDRGRDVVPGGRARRSAATDCGWCGGPITVPRSGPIPKWCSATCRHRAWEQSRAAASGRSAVQVVERVVTVPAKRSEATHAPRQLAWVGQLHGLARQLRDGLVYDRHLPAVGAALNDAVTALVGENRRADRRR